VALGLLVESKIAQLMGFLKEEHYLVVKTLLSHLTITASALEKFSVDDIINKTQVDKKKRAGLVHYVLLNNLGSVYAANNQFAHPVPDDIVKKAFFEV
jgi:3-dehydroquinate synthetase